MYDSSHLAAVDAVSILAGAITVSTVLFPILIAGSSTAYSTNSAKM